MEILLAEIRECRICEEFLPLGPHPVLSASQKSKIIVIGQAPGLKVHNTGIPWNDRSGFTLRQWLGVSDAEFYNTDLFGIIPMGFCYPGRGKGGDLPPRPECAPAWHGKLMSRIEGDPIFLLIGQYAQRYYLRKQKMKNLTETVAHFENYLPKYFPLPHPSPRNLMWLRRNPWFEQSVIPRLQVEVQKHLNRRRVNAKNYEARNKSE